MGSEVRTAQEERRVMYAVVGENQGAAQGKKKVSCAVVRARGSTAWGDKEAT